MVDLYGLGPGFPGHPPPGHLPRHYRICGRTLRFIPYLQLHEYEAILFSDPTAFATGINRPNLQRQFQRIRDQFESPEDIDNDPETAPSKRVLAVCPDYRKVIEGTLAAAAVGIPIMREECRHFRAWIESLEALGLDRGR